MSDTDTSSTSALRLAGATQVAATIGAGLSAGLFDTFQVAVTRGLAEVDDVAYVTTFQAMNDKIVNPWFLGVYLGAPVLTAAALVLNRRTGKRIAALNGSALVLNLALLAITARGNIPLNDELAKVVATSADAAAAARNDFETPWNRLNLVRTIVSVGGFASLAVATLLKPSRLVPRTATRSSGTADK